MAFLWFLSQFRTTFTEGLFQTVTLFGQQTILVALISICFWCINKELAFQTGFTFCLSGTLVQGMKLMFRIPRPWILDPEFKPVESAVEAATGYSFPSGHTQSAVAIYGTLGFKAKKTRIRILCYILAALVGFSRMFLGVHTPKDVLCAIVVSAVCIWLVDILLIKSKQKGESCPKLLLAVVSFSALLLYLYGYVLSTAGIVEQSHAFDCAQITGAALGFVAGFLLEEHYIQFDPKQKALVQIIKSVVGLILLVLIEKTLKVFLPMSMFWAGVQNLILILFITFFYPFIFNGLLKRKS